MQNVILLNNLFNGEYIKEKVGGEIINMYQSDNDNYYVYINPYGNIEKKWDNSGKSAQCDHLYPVEVDHLNPEQTDQANPVQIDHPQSCI